MDILFQSQKTPIIIGLKFHPSEIDINSIGVPAAPLAATGTESGETYYITPDQLSELIDEYGTAERFGGIMMWSAGFSDSNVNDGCTYAQEAHAILEYGSPCSDGPSTSSQSTATTLPKTTTSSWTETTTTTTMVTVTTTKTTTTTRTTTTSSSATATATGTVGEWGQCGGEGYTGSTVCESPYVCVELSVWWSQCEAA